MNSTLLLVHLVSFAAYIGAGFGQLRLMRRSGEAGLSVDTVKELERLSLTVIRKIELPAVFVSIASGVGMLAMNMSFLRQGWLHGKLTVVLVLAVLTHLEMFNARNISRLRESGASDDEINAKKKRHALLGNIGSACVVVLLILVTFVRLRGN